MNNRKATRGRRQIFIGKSHKETTAFGTITVQDPVRKEKFFIVRTPDKKGTYMSKYNH